MRLQWRLTGLERSAADGQYTATFDTPDGVQSVMARSVVSTAPAHALTGVLSSVLPEASGLFERVRR